MPKPCVLGGHGFGDIGGEPFEPVAEIQTGIGQEAGGTCWARSGGWAQTYLAQYLTVLLY